MKLQHFIKDFLPIPKLTGKEYTKIEYILFEVENTLYRAIQELELWYIHRHNLMPRNLDVYEPVHPDDLPF